MKDKIQLGRLDHMHLVVPDREEAARWYEEKLGFERVQAYKHWWAIPGAPIHLSADGGDSGVALFQAGEGHELTHGIGMGVAFRLAAKEFITFARALGGAIQIDGKNGQPLMPDSMIDLDLCFSFGFFDPYGHELELTCYDYDEVKRDLVEADGISPVRYW